MSDHLITSMNDQQQDRDDQLSFCSDFEQLSHCSNIDGDGEDDQASTASDGRTFSASELGNNADHAQQQQNPSMMTAEQQQSLAGEDIGDEHSMAAHLHICELETEMLLKKVEQLEVDKIAGDERHKVLEGRVAQLVDAIEELRVEQQGTDSLLMQNKNNMDQKLADSKKHTDVELGAIKHTLDKKFAGIDLQMNKMLSMTTTPVNNELQLIKMRLELLEDEGRAKAVLMKLVEKEHLMEWLITGAGLLRNVSLLRIAANQLVTWGGWKIHNSGLNATLIKADCFCANIRAAQPFPVVARPAKQLLYYFEVTVTGTISSIFYLGLCGPDFPFTSTTASVGAVAGSFAICKDGDYGASGQWHSGFGKGVLNNGDVVGCGLLVLPSAERHLFFTKSGEIWGKPILLGPSNAEACMYPIVSAYDPGTEVVFNFGADLVAKPFRYELAHLAVIDG